MNTSNTASRAFKKSCWHEMEFRLQYGGPFHWESLLDYFKSHEIGGTEKVSANSYERVFEIDGVLGFLRLTPHLTDSALVLKLWVQNESVAPLVVERIRKMFDLDLDHNAMFLILKAHRIFDDTIQAYPALRVAKGWDPFEIVVLTILGQVVSVKRAKDLLHNLVVTHGVAVQHPVSHETFYLFPTPKQLSNADLGHLGTTQARKQALKLISKLVIENSIDFANDEIEILKEKLLAVPGVGKWSVEYIALRGVGHPDSFPETDLALKRVMDYYPEFNIEIVKPWRSYAAVYLWKDYMMQPEKYRKRKP